jgi:NitT/TauT family transport system substrate-binding protein
MVPVLVAALLVLAACGSDGDKPAANDAAGGGTTTTAHAASDPFAPQPLAERTSMRVGLIAAGQEPYGPMILAKELGEFEKENLDVSIDIVPIQDAAVLLAQDKLDAAPLVFTAGVYNQLSTKPDFRLVAGLPWLPATSKSGVWVRTADLGAGGKVDPCDFKGKTVAFGPALKGTTAAVGLLEFLQKCDLTLDDIKASPLTGPDAVIALENGAVDAAVVFDPLWKQLDQKGVGTLAVPLYAKGAVFEGTSPTGWFFGPVRHKNPEAVKAMLRAIGRTTRDHFKGDYHADPETRKVLAKALGVPETNFDATASLEADPTLPVDADVVETMQAAWMKIGLLTYKEPIAVSDIVDDSLRSEVFGK